MYGERCQTSLWGNSRRSPCCHCHLDLLCWCYGLTAVYLLCFQGPRHFNFFSQTSSKAAGGESELVTSSPCQQLHQDTVILVEQSVSCKLDHMSSVEQQWLLPRFKAFCRHATCNQSMFSLCHSPPAHLARADKTSIPVCFVGGLETVISLATTCDLC